MICNIQLREYFVRDHFIWTLVSKHSTSCLKILDPSLVSLCRDNYIFMVCHFTHSLLHVMKKINYINISVIYSPVSKLWINSQMMKDLLHFVILNISIYWHVLRTKVVPLNESASLLSSSCFIQIENMMLLTVLINWEAENLTVRFQNRTTVTVSSFGLGKSSIIPISKCARSTFYLQLVIGKFQKAHKVQGFSKTLSTLCYFIL